MNKPELVELRDQFQELLIQSQSAVTKLNKAISDVEVKEEWESSDDDWQSSDDWNSSSC